MERVESATLKTYNSVSIVLMHTFYGPICVVYVFMYMVYDRQVNYNIYFRIYSKLNGSKNFI